MEYKTYGYLRGRIENDLDLQGENFITPAEMIGYFNEAIDKCEAEILTTYEDYFLARSTESIVSGTESYDLPSNIYANKLRSVIYKNNDQVYPIRKVSIKDKFIDIELMKLESGSNAIYRYFILNNSSASNPQLNLVPTPLEDVTDGIIFYYIRNANRVDETQAQVVSDLTVIDIPEFYTYLLKYVKNECYKKEGHPEQTTAAMDLEAERRTMIDTLSNMIPDGDSEIPLDDTFYQEMS